MEVEKKFGTQPVSIPNFQQENAHIFKPQDRLLAKAQPPLAPQASWVQVELQDRLFKKKIKQIFPLRNQWQFFPPLKQAKKENSFVFWVPSLDAMGKKVLPNQSSSRKHL